jgi:hypothetical protein
VPAPDAPPILSRAEWGAADPVLPMRSHIPRQITIHHTASNQAPARSTADKMRGLQRFSQQRAELADGRMKEQWADIPYHFYIAVDGTVAEGRDSRYAGDSNTNYDVIGQIQIVLEGNFEHERPTAAQVSRLRSLTISLADRWEIPSHLVRGHRDHVETLCPGEALYRQLPELRENVARATTPAEAG